MSIVSHLAGFVVRQVVGEGAEKVVGAVVARFADSAGALPRALARANDRSWQALGVALAGDGFLERIGVLVSDGDARGLREQVQAFLASCPVEVPVTMPRFRQLCLAELRQAQQAGDTRADTLTGDRVGQDAAAFQRYADPQGLVEGATAAVARLAEALAPRYPNLALLLRTPTPAGPPLLAAAFAYFFRREVEVDDELANGLLFDGLRQLSASQARGLAEVNKALNGLGGRFDEVLEGLSRVEVVVTQTHQGVLDLGVELERLKGVQQAGLDELRSLLREVAERLTRAGMSRGELRPHQSCSIQDGDDRRAVKTLVARAGALPTSSRPPALSNGLGKLLVGTGEYASARALFLAAVQAAADPAAQAEAYYNAYRAALEARQWDDALEAILGAARRDAGRFAPFPLDRYEPKRILGAGGFGTAYLCHDRNFGDDVVIKTLHAADLERSMKDVFAEAIALRRLSHPAIIGVQDCEYADRASQGKPYIVMEYFNGQNLDDHLQASGALSPADLLAVARPVAEAMQAAHSRGVLHRDLKPANLLVRKQGGAWAVKVIDFGLALRRSAVEASLQTVTAGGTGPSASLGASVAGTIKYAPPEQLGQMPGVKPGPHSDVYAFGKLCCQALFGTTEPRRRQWSSIPEPLAEVLEKCLEEQLEHRHPDFGPVLRGLEAAASLDVKPPVPVPVGMVAPLPAPAPSPAPAPASNPGPTILGILHRHFGGMTNPYLHPNIPARKLRNVLQAYAKFLPAGDEVLLVYDGTLFGAANEGFIFTKTAFGYCDTFSSPVWMPYTTFLTQLAGPAAVGRADYTNISLSGGGKCFVYAGDIGQIIPALQASLQELRQALGV